jgi:hypothetical protein
VLLRLIIWGIVFYLIYRFLSNVFRNLFGIESEKRSEVKGEPKGNSFNIDDQDIEDADFEEIK